MKVKYLPATHHSRNPMPSNEPNPTGCESEAPIEITPGTSRSTTTIQNAVLREDHRILSKPAETLPRDGARKQRADLVDEILNGDRTTATADPINITDAPPE